MFQRVWLAGCKCRSGHYISAHDLLANYHQYQAHQTKISNDDAEVVLTDENVASTTDDSDKISTSLVECERVKEKIGKSLRADGSPRMWKKFPPAREQKGFLS